MILETLPGSTMIHKHWSDFISQVVAGKVKVESKALLIKAKTLKEEPLKFEDLTKFTGDEVRERMRECASNLTPKQPGTLSKL